jgi:hypothetical protein
MKSPESKGAKSGLTKGVSQSEEEKNEGDDDEDGTGERN